MKRIFLNLLFTILALMVAIPAYAGTVTIISPVPTKFIKPAIPKAVANQRVTIKGFVNIGQLAFLLEPQVSQTVELIGTGKSKAFIDFDNARLIKVLRYIKDVYGFNYKCSRTGILKLSNIETAVFHLPFTPLTNNVTASLGSSSNGMGASPNTTTSSTSLTASSLGSSSSGSLGGYASENVSNISTPFFTKFLKQVKTIMGKNSYVMFSARYGTLILKGKVKKVEVAREYIKNIKNKIGKVIFVKLKIINVQLSNGYSYGINWNNLYTDMGHYLGEASSLSVNLSNTPTNSLSGSDNITFNNGTGTQAVINALNNFGKVNIVNQAKLELLSGQTRTLNNITTIPYLEGNQITSVGALGSSAQSTPQIGEATSGINVVYTPIVSKNKIYVSVQLILNTINSYTTYSSGGSTFTLPNVSTQSASFTISVPNGKSALVGALQYKSNSNNKEGIPILDDIPILGYLFSGGSNEIENNELFLLITPVIVKE